jgi:uncharacterized protein YqgV (UPF0045/DUF77 family)
MRTAVEISMYPLGEDYRPKIQAFIDRLHTYPGLRVQTNSLSTQVWGELDYVLGALGREMEAVAAAGPQPVFVLKVLPGLAPPEAATAP